MVSEVLDAKALTTVLYDWMPDGADVSVGFDGASAHFTGSDLAAFIFDRAREYDQEPARTAGDPRVAEPLDWEALRMERHWPTPLSMSRVADALDMLMHGAKYGDILRWVAEACDASLDVAALSSGLPKETEK
jgi:hypothetical protein